MSDLDGMDAIQTLRRAHRSHLQALSNLRGLQRDLNGGATARQMHARVVRVLGDVRDSHAGFLEVVEALNLISRPEDATSENTSV
jgi:hypothetical protein